MSRYKKILGSDHGNNIPKNEVTKIRETHNVHILRFYDPRPDLDERYGDSVRWTILLELAHGKDPELYGRLHGMRCQGSILKKSRRWGRIMQPVIDPDGLTGWVSQREYDEVKQRWLDPYRREIIALLGKI